MVNKIKEATQKSSKLNNSCIFCKIATHKIPSEPVLENDKFIAIYDINPVSKGHTLVIPKKHIKDFFALPNQDANFIKEYLDFIAQVTKILQGKYSPKGIRISWNTYGLLEVNHIHAHLIPVY